MPKLVKRNPEMDTKLLPLVGKQEKVREELDSFGIWTREKSGQKWSEKAIAFVS